MAHVATLQSSEASALRRILLTAIVAVTLVTASLAVGSAVRSAEATVGLGTADSFAVLAGSTITNTGSTTITGDIGLHDGSSFPGYDDGADSVTHLDGDLYISDAGGVALGAKNDLAVAYVDAAGRSVTGTIGTELGGATLVGGVYDSASTTFEITGTLTLDAENNPDTVWIFQMGSSLLATTGSSVAFINGGDACNVFWQVGSSATLDAGATFAGTIMALTSIFVGAGVTVDGRLLARNGEVTLINDTITRSECTTGGVPTDAPTGAPLPTGPDSATLPPASRPDDTGNTLPILLLLGTVVGALLLLRPVARAKAEARRR